MQPFEGKVALVTGASRGIGRAIASTLARRGAAVAVNYRTREAEAMEVVREIEELGGCAVALRADVSDPAAAEDLVAGTMNTFGGLDVLVNNAGITNDGLLWKMADDAWWEVLRVNLGGTVNCTRAAAPHLMAQRSGSIVNISSVMGVSARPGLSAYSASKGALNSFTRASATELARFGVRVNAVLGGVVPTDLISGLLAHDNGKAAVQIPMRQYGTAEQLASVAAFLAGPDAEYMTGELVHVDGGMGAQVAFFAGATALSFLRESSRPCDFT
ncbi:SDR family NAD(P)-dependent oxidoreductase [Nocardia sp. bgisy134]|uniref:SDR family NAD(P)-dependent oxidoreductase n=1 Tax=unclassified Nocardia TaxID=2637762 RepID=UPI003D73BE58